MAAISHCTILAVDDTEANIDVLMDTLGHDYELMVAMDGPAALEAVATAIADGAPPDLILLDIMMPGMNGYAVCERLKADATTADIPVIFLTALTEIGSKTRGFQVGAVDYMTKPFEIREVRARVETHLSLALARRELANQNQILEQKVRERTRELALTQDVTIHALASLAETRDNETGGHIRRTQNYVRVLAEHLREPFALADGDIEMLYKSAPLHDIGKVGIPDAILLKPGRLTEEEFEVMKSHLTLGMQALAVAEDAMGNEECHFLRFAKEIAHCHHERWDGAGYPQGQAGDAIPLSARLMALADVYDALISRRVYKPPFPHARAVEMILEGRGTHFDPRVTDAFLVHEEDFRQIALANADHQDEIDTLSQVYVRG
ncbi:response regulator [Thiorhodovibrio frisius]|uniref:Response regulator containing a CheY-like receiver domain and an HD-GYP domain n=1 Tax=Thiorhodovibrio frisius TaxID=631362 RepID=H8Z539_9GAMM|nr:two-component system response regulator [Thiorhodovibrio frisius]EIC20446.1 response regulator containing a CheY-like receiver domain and an HD-GYP domain [Thiorhodovibrio frisius]WPL21189.1 Cyclic di-GMP phosphodiesterase response regulator RpfG [Thiorhodovibrio frisius]